MGQRGPVATVVQLPGRARAERRRTPDREADPPNHDPAHVYQELAPAVLGYLRSQHLADPEDVLGDVFHHVARDLPRFRGDHEALRRWVFTIAHNRLIDDRRRRAVRPEELRAELPETPAPVHASSLDPELLDALGALTDDQREVVALRFVADLSLRDVARITDRRTGAVKALQTRALANLRVLLSDESAAASRGADAAADRHR